MNNRYFKYEFTIKIKNGNNMVCFVLLDIFQVMHLANMEIDSKFLRWFTKTVGKWLRKTLGTWLRKVGVSSNCARCHLQAETQKHCLVWQRRALEIFANYFPPLAFTWVMVVWTSFVHSISIMTPNIILIDFGVCQTYCGFLF